jgi:NAD(P)-dependent dehydrogenase (short-subunit alcohol dehydrogenase family)
MLGTVIVTGGARGLGAAVAAAVAGSGGRPVVLDRDIPADGHEHVAVDLADTAATGEAVDRVAQRDGLNAVVTCAGIDACGPLTAVDRVDWERVVQVNLLGTAAVVRAALPHLEPHHGSVVTVASTLGLRALPDATAYCASKFGVVGFTRGLAAEVNGKVRVTCLIPGGMRTSFFDGREAQYRPGPDADLMDPAHVAQVVLDVLTAPPSLVVRELVVTVADEPSWP